MRIATVLGLAACASVSSCGYCSQRVVPEQEFGARERDRPLLTPEPAADPPPAMDAATIRGTVVRPLDAAPPPAGAVLFVFVRPAGQDAGPPLAVERLRPTSFPTAFAIGPADAMIPGTPFPERVMVEARLDADGNASTTGPGDERARSEALAPGEGGVRLTLSPAPGVDSRP